MDLTEVAEDWTWRHYNGAARGGAVGLVGGDISHITMWTMHGGWCIIIIYRALEAPRKQGGTL